MEQFKLSQLSLRHKLIASLFLILMGCSYLFAQLNLQLHVRKADGDASGLATIRDIIMTYHGDRSKTLLGTKINGSMREHLPTEEDKIAIEKWISNGRTENDFIDIEPILEDNCIGCHPYGEKPDYPLETYEQVYASAEPDMGPSVGHLAEFSHFHAFGMGMFAFLLALLFSLTSFSSAFRMFGSILPFVAILIDIISWWLTKLVSPIFAYTIFLGGALTGLAFLIIIFGGLYDLWFRFERRQDV